MYIPKLHKIWLCQNDKGGIYMYPKMANRHGLIAGATGTGKTVTLKVLAESFSEMGVPVFWLISRATFPVCACPVRTVKDSASA